MAMASLAAKVLLIGLFHSIPLPASCSQAAQKSGCGLGHANEESSKTVGRRSTSTHANGQAGNNRPAKGVKA